MLIFLKLWLLATWAVISLSSIWFIVGLFFAGVLHVFIPSQLVKKHLKQPGFLSVIKSSLFGIPMPLCSCSVVPVAVSLRRSGASKGATASFLVSTPEIGVDSFFLSYVLLGPFIAFVRIFVTLFSALGVGVLIDKFSEHDTGMEESTSSVEGSSCRECCKTETKEEGESKSLLSKILNFGYVEVVDDLSVYLLIGFFGAGLISVLIPNDFFSQLSIDSNFSLILALLASLPVYICATSSTPIAAALLGKGLSAGAVVVMLLAGPATNLATILIVKKELGNFSLKIYLLGIALFSLLAGVMVNHFEYLIPEKLFIFKDSQVLEHHQHLDFLQLFGGLALSLILALSLLRKIRK